MFGVVALSKITPTGFLPEDDQGAFFVVTQLPGGASVARTSEVVHKAEQAIAQENAVADYTSIIGLNFIDNYSQSNSAFFVVTLKPFEERQAKGEGANAIIARLNTKLREIQGGSVVPLPASADHRSWHGRRLHLCAQGPEGRRSKDARASASGPARSR